MALQRRDSSRIRRQLAASGALATLCALGLGGSGVAQEPAQPAKLELHPAFEIELAAMEPLVFNPVDLEFDEHGRALVLEMPGYPIVAEGAERLGRIVVLADDDRDGRFDRRTVFAAGFRYADSLLPYLGGVLVADPPNLVWVCDLDGDGRAETRQTVLGGFTVGPSESNVNGLRHGIDNWVYGANGSNGGNVFLPEDPDRKTPIAGQDFRFRFARIPADADHLTAGVFETAGPTGGGFGFDFDRWGRRFVTHEQRHVQVEVLLRRYLPRGHRWPRTLVEISGNGRGGSNRMFPISVAAPRIDHPERAATSPAGSGPTFYDGGAFPAAFSGNVFVAEAAYNLVHRDVIAPDGAGFVARSGREGSEFLASADPSFRPVNLTVGPSGELYVLDVHRDVNVHPEGAPDELERTIIGRPGVDRGRIYRIVPRGGGLAAEANLAALEAPALVELLRDPNRWRRSTAQRLLVGRADPAAIPSVRVLALAGSAPPVARLHALWTLEGLGALDADALRAALGSPEAGLRENALRLAERFLPADHRLLEAVVAATGDRAHRVRMQALLSLATSWNRAAPRDRSRLVRSAAEALASPSSDRWIRVAALALAAQRPTELLATDPLRRLERRVGAEVASEVLEAIGRLIGERTRAGELELALLTAASLPSAQGVALLRGLAAALTEASAAHRLAPVPSVSSLRPLLEAEDELLALQAFAIATATGVQLDADSIERFRRVSLPARRAPLRSPHADVRLRAGLLFDDEGVITRQAAVAKMRPALDLDGNPIRGRAIFSEHCGRCHRRAGYGADVGPNLDDAARKSSLDLLRDIVDPNAGVDPSYPVDDVESSSDGLSLQAMADLMAFLKGETAPR